eukprot:COSAG02_NODE_3399_length_6811_cov_16.128278_7_plen_55_part_00
MTQFWRRWIPTYSSMVSPLTDMLKKGIDFRAAWGPAQDKVVSDVKKAMSSWALM